MEQKNSEAIVIADEELEDVSGGVIQAQSAGNGYLCPICRKIYMHAFFRIHKNREICIYCYNKQTDQ